MRTINFNEMALLNGGQIVAVSATPTDLTFDSGLSGKGQCGVFLGIAMVGSVLAIASVAMTGGATAGIAVSLAGHYLGWGSAILSCAFSTGKL